MVLKEYAFSELSADRLYDVLQLRCRVFVVEQACAYQDIDGIDRKCLHIIGEKENQVVGYARILPPRLNEFNHVSIGRVLIAENYRHKGFGAQLMKYSLKVCKQNYPTYTIHIKAQNYLEKFYSELGFAPVHNYFLEDNLPHQEMIYGNEKRLAE